jgi:hypothetical protein
MSKGGVPDKMGNDYEYCYGIRLLCDLLTGEAVSVQEDDVAVETVTLCIDFIVVGKDGRETIYQCKGTSGSNSRWSLSSLRDVYAAAASNFDKGQDYVFVSGDRPSIKNLMDTAAHYRRDGASKFLHDLSKKDKKAVRDFEKVLPPLWRSDDKVFEFLQRFRFLSFGGEKEDIRRDIGAAGLADVDSSYNFLEGFTKVLLANRPNIGLLS